MKNFVLIKLLRLLIASGFAQHTHDHELGCAKAKFYQEYFKSVQDIYQTPLLFDYDVKFYYLDIEVDNSSIYIAGETTIMAEVTAAELDTFAIELLNQFTVDEVTYNGNRIIRPPFIPNFVIRQRYN